MQNHGDVLAGRFAACGAVNSAAAGICENGNAALPVAAERKFEPLRGGLAELLREPIAYLASHRQLPSVVLSEAEMRAIARKRNDSCGWIAHFLREQNEDLGRTP